MIASPWSARTTCGLDCARGCCSTRTNSPPSQSRPCWPSRKNHLQRKADVAVEILVKTVITAGLVMKHQRRRLGLPGFVANFQKSGVLARTRRRALPKNFRPMIGDDGKVRIRAASELCNRFRKRVREILVISDAEAIALHNDVAAKTAYIIVERHKGSAFRNRQNRSRDRVPALRKRLPCVLPIQRLDPFSDRK